MRYEWLLHYYVIMIIKLIHIVDLLFKLRLKRSGFQIGKKLRKMGPTFVKFGQSFSTRPDIFGEEITQSLLTLCDNLPPFKFRYIKQTLETEFNVPLNEAFSYFEKEPLSAASIAQVHKARTVEGFVVAVKILRPNIKELFQQDIRLLKFCSTLLKPFLPKRFRISEVIELFVENIKFELDMRFEAANAVELRKNAEELYIPEVYWKYTSTKVLTTEWVDGKSISQIAYSPKIAEVLATSFVKQAYYQGCFHGDMHSGNILITEDEQVALVDFGIVGRLDQKTKMYVAEILIGFLKRDYEYVAKVHFRAGYVRAKYEHFVVACCAIGETMVNNRISVANLLGQLFKISADFDIKVQPKLLLLQKTILLVEGHCLRLYPEMDLLQLIKPRMKSWEDENLNFRNKICNMQIVAKVKSVVEKIDGILESLIEKK